jgi:hypothetical protein
MVDNITPTVNKVEVAEKTLETQMAKTTQSVDSQKISFMAEIVAVSAVYRSINMLSGSMSELGLINDKTAQSLRKVSAGVGLVLGAYQGMKGAIAIVEGLKGSTTLLAMVETYRATLKNPAMMALAVGGIATAAGVGGYFAGKSAGGGTTNSSNVNQSFTFGSNNNSDSRTIAQDTLEIMGG